VWSVHGTNATSILSEGDIEYPIDLFKNKKNQQVNLFPASGGWILDILNP
jgi:hypothetical protein